MLHVKGFGELTFDELSLDDCENLDGAVDQFVAIVLGFAEPVVV